MRTLLRVIALILSVLMMLTLVSCGKQGEDEPLTTDDGEKVSAPPAEHTGYYGTMDGYVYLYKSGRNRNWEEDVLYFSENVLARHPRLVDEVWIYGVSERSDKTDEFYDPILREEFILRIDSLIYRIAELSDTEILCELDRTASILRDVNTNVSYPLEYYFPIRFVAIYENGGTSLYVTSIQKDYAELIFGRLEAINGMPVADVMSLVDEYTGSDSSYWKTYCTSHYDIINAETLEAAGIIDHEPYVAEFTVMTEQGSITAELSAISNYEFTADIMESKSLKAAESLSYQNSDRYYWCEGFPDEGMVFVRMNYCYQMSDYTYSDFFSDIMKNVNSYDEPTKLVFDLRGNIPGNTPKGFDGFLASLKRAQTDGVYILIDSGTILAPLGMTVSMKTELDNAVVIGEPAGQSPNMLLYTNYFKFRHFDDAHFLVSDKYYIGLDGYDDITYMPDILVYQTFDDYKQGIDTVLEAVKSMD